MSEGKQELIRVLLMTGVVIFEWYAMQPYHEPVMARFWLFIARFCQRIAAILGRMGLTAEHHYYVAAEMGL